MSQISSAQQERIWTWCGWHVECGADFAHPLDVGTCYWVDPDGNPADLPALTLEKLFRWAPKDVGLHVHQTDGLCFAWARQGDVEVKRMATDPAEALTKALLKLIDSEETKKHD